KMMTTDSDYYKVRYADPYFFVSDRDELSRDEELTHLAGWTHDDALHLDRSMADAKIIIVAMRAALRHLYVRTKAGSYARIERPNIRLYLHKRPAWFMANFAIVDIDVRKRLALIQQAFEVIDGRGCPDADIFVMGA